VAHGLAPPAGIHAMSFAVLLTSGALLTLVFGTSRARVTAAVTAVVVWGVGFAAQQHAFTQPKERELAVALVQGAVTQDLKWRPEQLPGTLALYSELTKQSYGADLIVWPEAAIPTVYEYVRDYLDNASPRQRGSTVLLWHLAARHERRETTGAFQNILLALTEEPQVYVKRHCAFGEYFPVPSFIRSWMRLYESAVHRRAAGRWTSRSPWSASKWR
jgi:apolipoprotein N-acyltransferase